MKNAKNSEMASAPDRSLPFYRQLGPRPLALHLSLAMMSMAGRLTGQGFAPATGGPEALPRIPESVAREKPDIEIPMPRMAAEDIVSLSALEARGRDGLVQLGEMIKGIERYHQHPFRRNKPVRPTIWSAGTTCLRDYRTPGPHADAGPVVLFVPSLVNRAYVLDLLPQRSMLDFLASEGLSPFLVDWGAPGAVEKEFTLTDYIAKRLVPVFDFLSARFAPRPVHLAGYCMGGTLAMGLAAIVRDRLASLSMLAAPWDFHAELNPMARLIISNKSMWQTILNGYGELPVDLLQAFFASLDPELGMRKFTRFAAMHMDSAMAEEFVALEDWLNDGVPLARKVAAQCFADWYGSNDPCHGRWKIGDQTVSPDVIARPSFFAIPRRDKIVPAASALALAQKMKDPVIVRPGSGHIGMVTGRKAPAEVWRPFADWIQKLA